MAKETDMPKDEGLQGNETIEEAILGLQKEPTPELLAHVLTASRAAKSLRRMSGGSKASHNARRADSTSVGGGNPASGHAQTSTGGDSTAANGVASGSDPNMPASFEPTPITAEIPLVPDPVTGEVH